MELFFWGAKYSFLFIVAALWTLPWKGIALWKAARRSEKGWFVALFLINTLGVLEILYIFVFSKKPPTQAAAEEPLV